jgi:hypothetical protein
MRASRVVFAGRKRESIDLKDPARRTSFLTNWSWSKNFKSLAKKKFLEVVVRRR